MSKILLIDADSTIPNIPLMKLSTFYKQNKDTIYFRKLNLPYFPDRKKRFYFAPRWYDKIYCSVIFEGNKEYIKGKNIIFGGTGIDLVTKLPDNIENLPCDYSLYPTNDTSYGFITRGCIRKCSFCKVPEKEGKIKKVANINDIVQHKKVKFLDNNILAYPDHDIILKELIKKKIKCQFNQGLDIRLITEKNSSLLSQLRYLGDYIFAFDDWKYKDTIEERLSLLNWRKDWQFKFFVYTHPNMPITNIVKRIEWLKVNKCLPYIMRDISCWGSKYNEFYIDIATFCNQVHLFKTLDFETFLNKRHSNKQRIKNSLNIYHS